MGPLILKISGDLDHNSKRLNARFGNLLLLADTLQIYRTVDNEYKLGTGYVSQLVAKTSEGVTDELSGDNAGLGEFGWKGSHCEGSCEAAQGGGTDIGA